MPTTAQHCDTSTMSQVSHPHMPRTIVTIPDSLDFDVTTPPKNLDEYNLFILLKKQRTARLRELYQGGRYTAKLRHDPPQGDALPNFQPRYWCLNFSARCLLLALERLSRDPSSKRGPTREQWRALDRSTKMFLGDGVAVLRAHFGPHN